MSCLYIHIYGAQVLFFNYKIICFDGLEAFVKVRFNGLEVRNIFYNLVGFMKP